MDPQHSGEILKQLEKQSELLQQTHNKMSHELHRLQVQEEMLMRKFYEITSVLGLNKKNVGNRLAINGAEDEETNPLANAPSDSQ